MDIYTPQLKAQRNWTCINVLHSPRESSLEAFNDVFLTSVRSSRAEALSGGVMWSFPPGNVFPPMIFFKHSRKTKAIWITDGDVSVCLINTELRAHHFCLKESGVKHYYRYSTNPERVRRVVLQRLTSPCLVEAERN